LALNEAQRNFLVGRLSAVFTARSAGDDVRWNVALITEILVQWDPLKVPSQLLLTMAGDPYFGVRSSAAVSYYYLAGSSPDSVPVEMVGRLASPFEDWYVNTPATNALLRLACTRHVAVDILAAWLSHEEKDARDHAAQALERLAQVHPAALREDLADWMTKSADSKIVQVGEAWKRAIEEHRSRGGDFDFYMF
jgi:hypothetical protein